MARPKLNVVVLDPGSGKARPGAWVSFYLANTATPTTLYADDDISTLANPVQANQLGQVAVRINPGLYDISMTWDGAQPTVVEDVLAYTPETAILSAPGDMIVSDAAGNPTRLPIGSDNQVLVVEGQMPRWYTLGQSRGLPIGHQGSLVGIGPGPEGNAILISPGLQDQALAMAGGYPTWVSTLLPPGTTLPINQPGDLVVGAVTTGSPARLARGQTDDVLRVDPNGSLFWGSTDMVGPGGGQCFLTLFGEIGEWLSMFPWKGNQIWIDGRARTIPDAGDIENLAATGLTPHTTYYIYAAWTGTHIKLEASTTGHTLTGGLSHKTGDPSRTLVGMARPGPGPQWFNTPQARFIRSFFSPRVSSGTAFFTAPRTRASPQPTGTEINPEIRIEFLCWGWEQISVQLSGSANASGPSITFSTTIVLDNVTQLAGVALTSSNVQEWNNISATYTGTFAEGHHYVGLHGATSGAPGTITWHGDPNGILTTRLHTVFVGAG